MGKAITFIHGTIYKKIETLGIMVKKIYLNK
jgi:hypothetical protein